MKNLLDKLKDITGIKLEYYRDEFLNKRINFRVRELNLDSHQKYLEYLLSNPQEINYFLQKFTINYTHFFRNYKIFEKFEELIRNYIKRMNRTIRIWSAPCATGDEPYSIAMIMEKLKKEIINFPNYEIVASDIDKTALDIAKTGIYGEYSVHEIPNYYETIHFIKQNTPIGLKFSVSNEIKEKVEFIEEDIIKGHKKNIKYDIIFCRNFFIYINKPSQEKLLRMLENHLVEGGILILGKTEMIMNSKSSFQTIDSINHIYIKGKVIQNVWIDKKLESSVAEKRIKREGEPAEKKYIKTVKKEIIKPVEKKTIKPQLMKSAKPVVKKPVKTIEKKTTKPIEVRTLKPVEVNVIKPEVEESIIITEKPEIKMEQQVINFNDQIKQMELKGAKLEKLIDLVKKQELQLGQREIHLNQKIVILGLKEKEIEHRENQLNQKEIILEQIEKDLEKRLLLFEQKEKELIIKEKEIEDQVNPIKKGDHILKKSEQMVNLYADEDADRIINTNTKGELNVPAGYYAIINSHDKKLKSTKFSIYGLGSGIVLILRDIYHRVYAISHISLPTSKTAQNKEQLKYPHKYVDTSVKDLLDKILYHGANKENIDGIIIGGAKNIYDQKAIYQENIDAINQELFKHQIRIRKKLIGGISERSIIFDTKNNSLYIKKKWEDDYRKVI
ncbi:MAG: CheR family methyltransferase [Promethearchaeota archaeon]